MKILPLHAWLLFHCKNCSCVSENYVYCISKIEKRLEYLLITNCWSQLTKNYNKLSEKFLPDSCTSNLEWVHAAPTSESRFRITEKDSENQEKIYAFLSEQEKRIKALLLLHLKLLLFFSFINTVLVWNFLSKGKRQIIKYVFFSQCVCNPLHAHVHTVLQKAWIPGMHTCTGSIVWDRERLSGMNLEWAGYWREDVSWDLRGTS